MRREYLRYGFILVLITCIFALLVSCGSIGDDESSTGSITLEVSLESIPADGVSSSAITAELKDASGNPVVGGTSVTFSTTLGTFSNGSTTYTEKTPDDPEIDPDDPEIDPTGIVVVSLMAGTTPGVANVTVQCSGVTQSISVEFTYAGPGGGVPVGEGFSLSPQYSNISGLWIAGLQDPVTAWVLDVNGNAVKDSTPIEFKTYNTGGLLDPYISATLGGFALSTLTSTPAPTPQQGFVSVTAETTGGPTTRVTSLAVTPTPYDYIMYAGTNGGGVYKSTDRGANWLNISRSSENPKQGQNWIEPYIKGHSAICVDPDDHNTVYVGTGYSGKGNVYRSLDGGMNWNSNNVEEWNGMNIYRSLIGGEAAVLTVLCDDGGSDYVWIGTEGRGPLYAVDGENFQPSGGTVTTPVPGLGNTGNGAMSTPILSYTSQTETWTATCTVPENASATVPVPGDNQGDGYMSSVTTSLTTKTEGWTVIYKGGASNVTSPGEISATVPVPGANAGDGWMSNVTTSATTKSEDWTVTYKGGASNVTSPGEMTATVPVPGDANQGNGWMSDVTISATTKSEDWTATYGIFADNVVSPAGKGTVIDIDVKAAATEIWTLTCIKDSLDLIDPTVPGFEIFSVTGSVSGPQSNAQVGFTYISDALNFRIISGATDFIVGDQITFDTTTYWQVSGTVSGVQTNAFTGIPYTSDGGEVGFTISAGSEAFADGDTFTFSAGGKGTVVDVEVKAAVTETWALECIGPDLFSVTGSVSGPQPNAEVEKDYDSDVIAFTIISGSVPFEGGDQITFDTTTYWEVEGTVSRVQTNTAANDTPYTSDDGEVGFTVHAGSVPFAIGDTFTFSIGGKGTVGAIEVKAAVTETWTLTCIDIDPWGWVTFSVTGSVSGAQPNATVDVPYGLSDVIAFTINSGSVPFEIDDQITFDTTTYWQVSGTVSGAQENTATTGTPYASDGGEVGFTINERGVSFAIGDSFTFSTTGVFAPFWTVEGTVSGVQWRWAQNNVPYTSDNYEVSFTIYEGAIAFATGDTFTFHVTANALSHGWTVWDIVKVPHTHGPAAVLYAATTTGVFKSVNGGQTWDEPGSFTGDSITTLTLHPTSTGAVNDIIYAGTLNAGVWVSTDSGAIWTQYPSGMEMGQSARIEDLLLDPMNDRLYAITFQGPPEQAVGNVYSHALNADGSMATGQWSKANTGLAGVGLHVMAADDPDNPGALFAGGEGINLYKAIGSGLTTGAPAWEASKNGLTNLIMARKPILFSGECSPDVSYWEYEGAYYFTVYLDDKNGNPPIEGSTFKAELWNGPNLIASFYDIIYGDCYTHQGTFSDPGNGYTNNPYSFAFLPLPGYALKIEFTSADTRPDDPNVPGYSGADQTLIYNF